QENLESLMSNWVNKGKITNQEKIDAFNHLTFTTDLREAAQNADFVIEAVVEKLEVKKEVFSKLDKIAPNHAIFASNSSTIVSSLIAESTNRKQQCCNMHFFFPPLIMDCIEIVKGPHTSEKTIQTALKISNKINRSAVVIRKEIHGFVANRILHALTNEALYLYEQGIANYEDIDLICKKALNHPMGPFELADLS